MVDLERIRQLVEKLGDRNDALEVVHRMRCGGRKFDGGGKFFVAPETAVEENPNPYRIESLFDAGNLIDTMGRLRVPVTDLKADVKPLDLDTTPEYYDMAPLLYDVPSGIYPPIFVPGATVAIAPSSSSGDLFSPEAKARRALKQRYAESAFNDRARSKAGAQGAWQIMPITLKDYLGGGRGKAGDLNDPEYNRKVRDWVMGIIPRDLKEFWSDSDSDRAKLAKLYAAYNWGAGNLRSFLRKKRDAGVDISNPDNWVDDLNPETRRYVKYLAFDEDIPDSTVYTNAAFEKAAADRGFSSGGKIHIAPSKRGTFTAAAKKHGKSVQAFASQVLAHKENYSPAMVKKANFARNSKKWKHGDGGPIDRYSPEQIRSAIAKLKETRK